MHTNIFLTGIGVAVLLALIFPACSDTGVEEEPKMILERTLVADMLGDHDGVASSQELIDLATYFGSNAEAWCITNCPAEYWSGTSIPATVVREKVLAMRTHAYPNEQALRAANAGTSIRTPYITISVVRQESQIYLVRLFRSPGSKCAEVAWEEMTLLQ